jgi:hypothetical protein
MEETAYCKKKIGPPLARQGASPHPVIIIIDWENFYVII